MRVPQVTDRLREAPAQALRAVFSGVGSVLLVADRLRHRPGQETGQGNGHAARPSTAPGRHVPARQAGRYGGSPPPRAPGSQRGQSAKASSPKASSVKAGSRHRQSLAPSGPTHLGGAHQLRRGAAAGREATAPARRRAGTGPRRPPQPRRRLGAGLGRPPQPRPQRRAGLGLWRAGPRRPPHPRPASAEGRGGTAQANSASAKGGIGTATAIPPPAADGDGLMGGAGTVTGALDGAGSGAADGLPMAGYDGLTVPQLRARMRTLEPAQLRAFIAHERAHAGRDEVVAMFERRLAKVRAADDAARPAH